MNKQLGISLIEVMVSVMVLGLGLLGLAALQARSVMMNQSAYYRSIAADLSADLSDRIRANRTPFLASTGADIATPFPPDFSRCAQIPANRDNIFCAPQDVGVQSYLVNAEMAAWNQFLRSQLPGAIFTLTSAPTQSAGFYRYNLTINWVDNRSRATATDPLSASYFTVIE